MTSKSKSLNKRPPQRGRSKSKALAFEVFDRLARANPNPRCELYFHTPYQLLVSVVLSAQTTDRMVNRCMQPVYDQGFTPEDAVHLGSEGLLPLIKSIGFAPTKSRNIAKLSEILLEQYSGQIPRQRDQLEALPGVGKKTASVVLAEVWNEPILAVDTHVFRVGRRLGLHRDKTPDKAADTLMAVIDQSLLPKAHHWLILHGRYTCKAIKPQCQNCSLADLCPSRAQLEL